MLTSAVVAPLNHLLRGSGWALPRLQPCVGKIVRIRVPPLTDLALAVQPSGEITAAPEGRKEEDATLIVRPGLLPRLLFHDEAAYDEIQISGDRAFGAEILHIGKNLHWDAEQDLSALIGDVAAHRVAEASGSLILWHAETFHNLSGTVREYLTEEQPILTRRLDAKSFIDDVNMVHDRTAQLEIRVDALMRRSR